MNTNLQILPSKHLTLNRQSLSASNRESYATSWKNALWVPSNENEPTVIESSFLTLELVDGFVDLLLIVEH